MNITILACGKIKKDSTSDMLDHYQKQFKWSVKVKEFNVSVNDAVAKKKQENELLLEAIDNGAYLIVLDETGKDIGSRDFAALIEKQQQISTKHIQIVIGGADGLTDEVRKRANYMLRFGKMTWPHKMVRLMLFEQIFRAQSIIDNHPYHRD